MTNAQKQQFLGGLIAGALVKKGVDLAIDKAVEKVAKKPNNSLDKSDAPVIAAEIQAEVQKEVQARVEHATDTEPHLSSRNLWGSLVGIITAAETIRVFWTDDTVQSFAEWMIPVGVIVTALTPLYSRFIAKKPLFR
ncbi:MAG: hypothetical protein JNK47_12670 [Mesorhizobium sp.]|nr:hypothetical protein [Mesorhizobium sp.]MBL8578074.1 hypothetical protein [Mesorhizobium sp.]